MRKKNAQTIIANLKKWAEQNNAFVDVYNSAAKVFLKYDHGDSEDGYNNGFSPLFIMDWTMCYNRVLKLTFALEFSHAYSYHYQHECVTTLMVDEFDVKKPEEKLEIDKYINDDKLLFDRLDETLRLHNEYVHNLKSLLKKEKILSICKEDKFDD